MFMHGKVQYYTDVSSPPKLINKFIAIPIQIPVELFTELDKLSLTLI